MHVKTLRDFFLLVAIKFQKENFIALIKNCLRIHVENLWCENLIALQRNNTALKT